MCAHQLPHKPPFNTRKRTPFLMNRPATNVREGLVSRYTPTLRWSSERGKAVYSLSSVVTNELDSHPPPPVDTRTRRTLPRKLHRHCRGVPSAAHPQLALPPHPSTRVPLHALSALTLFIYCRRTPSAAHLQLALPPARRPLPARPHPPARTLPTPYPALIYICLCRARQTQRSSCWCWAQRLSNACR